MFIFLINCYNIGFRSACTDVQTQNTNTYTKYTISLQHTLQKNTIRNIPIILTYIYNMDSFVNSL